MQITLPDDPKLRHRAQAAGFASVQDYVLQLVEHDVQRTTPNETPSVPESAEGWIQDLRAFIQSIPPSNPNFDDSRESMYPVP